LIPFETNHIEGQFLAGRRPVRFLEEERLQAAPKITQGKRIRGISFKVGDREFQKFPLSQDRQETRIVVVEAIEKAKPILAVVNFKPRKRVEPGVRFDEPRGLRPEVAPITRLGLHSPARGKRPEDRAGHRSLEIDQVSPGINPIQARWRGAVPEI
jgi:hypothetical protein